MSERRGLYRLPVPDPFVQNVPIGWEAEYALKNNSARFTRDQVRSLIRSNWLAGIHGAMIAVADMYDGRALNELALGLANRQIVEYEDLGEYDHRSHVRSYYENETIERYDKWCATQAQLAGGKPSPSVYQIESSMPEFSLFTGIGQTNWYKRSSEVSRQIQTGKVPVLSDQKALLALPAFLNTAIERRSDVVALFPSMHENSAANFVGVRIGFDDYTYADELLLEDITDEQPDVVYRRGITPSISLVGKPMEGLPVFTNEEQYVHVAGGNYKTTIPFNTALQQVILDAR